VDSFAAVDKKDQIDDLFEDEDQQRRQGALEQEQESAPKRFMSWAGAAFGKLTAGVAASRARAADQKSAERANGSEEKASRKSLDQRADDLHDMDDYADPLDDYAVDRSRGDDPRSASPSAQRDEYQDEFQEEFQEEFQQDSPEYYQRQHSDGHTDEPGDAGYADEYYEEYQSEPRSAEQHYQPPMTEQERKIAKYGQSPYTGHRFGVDSVPADPIAAASAAAASAAAASASAAASQSPYADSRSGTDSRTGAASPTQDAGGRAATAPRATSNATARNARENQLSLDMLQDDYDKDSGYSQVLVINVMARPKTSIQGDELLPILLGAGLRFGEMSIFHRHADRKGGPVLFSVANALNPGTFDLNRISDFSTQGVCFFMTLPNVANNMLAFEQMLATAKHMQSVLDAELKDDNRSVMTAQTVEHYRQRIRDFDLQQLKNSKNPRQK
jgi:cell division protein ZipA